MEIGERIKRLRKEKGVTQVQLAKDLNINKSTIGHYETNKRRPEYEILILLAQYLETSTDYILGIDKKV